MITRSHGHLPGDLPVTLPLMAQGRRRPFPRLPRLPVGSGTPYR